LGFEEIGIGGKRCEGEVECSAVPRKTGAEEEEATESEVGQEV
jgi:hypothetical protein